MSSSIAAIYRAAADWISARPEWLQGVIGGLVVAALLGFFPLLGKARSHLAQRREALARRAAEKAFERISRPAALGTADHMVNIGESPKAIVELNRSICERVITIEQSIMAATKRFPPEGIDDHAAKRRKVIADVSVDVHDQIVALEVEAAGFRAHSKAFIDGYKTLVNLPLNSPADRAALLNLRAGFGSQFAAAWKFGETAFSQRLQFVLAMHGHQQDLTREMSREADIIRSLITDCRSLHVFISRDWPRLIDRRLREIDGPPTPRSRRKRRRS